MYLQIVVISTLGEGSLVYEIPLTPWQYFSYGLFIGACFYVLTLRPFRFRTRPSELLALNVLIQGFFYLVMWHANGHVSGHVTLILGGIAGAALVSAIHKLVVENMGNEEDVPSSTSDGQDKNE